MAGMGQPAVERLRTFLRELKPGARALLIAELERSILRGDDAPGSELILGELRRCMRDSASKAQRIGDHARLFFLPIEPFLVEDTPECKHPGRVSRSTLEPMWLWLSNRVMPVEAGVFAEEVEQALLAGDTDRATQHAIAFQNQAIDRVQAMCDATGKDAKVQRQLSVHFGTPRAAEEVQIIVDILRARDILATLGMQLPGHIRALSGPSFENVKTHLDAILASKPNMIVYAMVLAMSRMAASWQLIRIATKAANSDTAARINETPYGPAVTIVLAELERMVRELSSDLKSGRGIAVSALLKDVHDAVRGLRTELDLPPESPWGKQLAAIRANISKLLSAEIELVMGRARRLLRIRPAKEIAPNSTIDADEIDDVDTLIGFVVACRKYASELAINEVTQRTFAELQQFLETNTRSLVDSLRVASDIEHAFRRSQIEAAVRFCSKVFGPEYAALLSKAAGIAAQDQERKAARA